MSISFGGNEYSFQLSQGSHRPKPITTVKLPPRPRAEYNGTVLDSDNFATWYQLVMSCQANAVNRSEVTSDPIMTVTYQYTDGSKDTVDYYDVGNRTVVVSVNGAKAVTTSTSFTNKGAVGAAKIVERRRSEHELVISPRYDTRKEERTADNRVRSFCIYIVNVPFSSVYTTKICSFSSGLGVDIHQDLFFLWGGAGKFPSRILLFCALVGITRQPGILYCQERAQRFRRLLCREGGGKFQAAADD